MLDLPVRGQLPPLAVPMAPSLDAGLLPGVLSEDQLVSID